MDFLKCQLCNLAFDAEDRKPLLLPCGHSFCKKCITELQKEASLKKCPQCFENLGTNAADLKPNFAILQLINQMPLFQQMQQMVVQQDPKYFCSKHKRDIEFYCVLDKTFLCSTCLLTHLDHKDSLKEVGINEIDENLTLLEKVADESKDKIDVFIAKIDTFKDKKIKTSEELNTLMKESLSFFKEPPMSDEKIKNSFILKSLYQRLDSVLLQPEDIELLQKWIGKSFNAELILRGTKQGFDSAKFHSLCDNKGPTICIFQSTQNKIFGGVSFASWTSNGQYGVDGQTFLFSITNKTKQKQINNFQHAQYFNAGYGPTWGGGHDLHIASNANQAGSSYSNLGYTYEGPNGKAYGNAECQSYLAGSYQFTLKEMEIFKLII